MIWRKITEENQMSTYPAGQIEDMTAQAGAGTSSAGEGNPPLATGTVIVETPDDLNPYLRGEPIDPVPDPVVG